MSDLSALVTGLGYTFQDPALLLQAVTHSSYRNEHPDVVGDNERLEFLGDSILGAVISRILFDRWPDEREGALTRYKSVLVSEKGLVATAEALGLGQHLRLGRGEDHSGGRDKPSVLSDAMEAVLAAVYLDGGFDATYDVVARLFDARLAKVGRLEQRIDFKTKLQERCQGEHKLTPRYRIVGHSGPDHARQYQAMVMVPGRVCARGGGNSKKAAQQRAAAVAFRAMTRVSSAPLAQRSQEG